MKDLINKKINFGKRGLTDDKFTRWSVFAVMLLFFSALLNQELIATIFGLVMLIFLLFRLDLRILEFFALVALAVCVIFFLLKTETLASQAAAYFYYLVAMTVILKVFEFRANSAPLPRQIIQKAVAKDAIGKDAIVGQVRGRKTSKMKKDLLILSLNIAAVIIYFIVFGTNWPSAQNYFQFIGLLIILIAVNLMIISLSGKTSLSKMLSNRWQEIAVKKNWIFLALINISILGAYLLIFGFNLPTLKDPIKFWLLATILGITNIVALIDAAND